MTLIVACSSQLIFMKGERIVGNIFEGEMLIITLSATFFQLFCGIILNSEVIVKSIIDPVNTDFFQLFCEIILNSEVTVKSIIDPVNNFESMNWITHDSFRITFLLSSGSKAVLKIYEFRNEF